MLTEEKHKCIKFINGVWPDYNFFITDEVNSTYTTIYHFSHPHTQEIMIIAHSRVPYEGILLKKTVEEPAPTFHELGPQHAECTPGSVTRKGSFPLTKILGEPFTPGPFTEWGQHGFPSESAGQCASSPTRDCGGTYLWDTR